MEKERNGPEQKQVRMTVLKHRTSVEDKWDPTKVGYRRGHFKKRFAKEEFRERKGKWIMPDRLVANYIFHENLNKKQIARDRVAKRICENAEEPTKRFVLIIVRVAKENGCSYEGRRVLEEMGLSRPYFAVFRRYTNELRQQMIRVLPFIRFVRPSVEKLSFLLHTHGYANIGDGDVGPKKRSVQSNVMIEKRLGHLGIICIADMVKELAECGPNVDEVTNFLAPFNVISNVKRFERSQPFLRHPKRGFVPMNEEMAFKFCELVGDPGLKVASPLRGCDTKPQKRYIRMSTGERRRVKSLKPEAEAKRIQKEELNIKYQRASREARQAMEKPIGKNRAPLIGEMLVQNKKNRGEPPKRKLSSKKKF